MNLMFDEALCQQGKNFANKNMETESDGFKGW